METATWTKQAMVVISTSTRIAAVLDFVRVTYSDSTLDLRRAAAAIDMSTFHLSRLLKRETGYGFAYHLRMARISHATSLFQTTTMSVKQVAAAVGYSSTNALDRNFKLVIGQTPTSFCHGVRALRTIVISSPTSVHLEPGPQSHSSSAAVQDV